MVIATAASAWSAQGEEAAFSLSQVQPYCVESRVDRGNQDAVISRSVTVYLGEQAYDFLQSPPEVTIIDLAERRIVMLNPGLREKAEVRFEDLLLFWDRATPKAQESKDPVVRVAARPRFEMRETDDGLLTFANEWLSYRVQGNDAPPPDVLRSYWEFSDWLCRLNGLASGSGCPPEARLFVNRVLAQRNLFPQEITLTLGPRNFLEWLPGRRPVLRSVHELRLTVNAEHRSRVAEARQWEKRFRQVSFPTYQKHLAGSSEVAGGEKR